VITAFSHSGFVVKDLDIAVKFYTEVLGLKVVRRLERKPGWIGEVVGFRDAHLKICAVAPEEGGPMLELIQYVAPQGGQARFNRNDVGASHVCFVIKDMDTFYKQASAKGLGFVKPPAALMVDGKVDRKAAYAQDPFGNWLEFLEVPT
jgi:catechol 2,3-dioxygenase-like lactoylglutathione lyase family enzyme